MLDRKKYDRKYYIKNKEKIDEQNKQWRKDNPEKMKEHLILWVKNNLGKYREYQKRYRKNNREKHIIYLKQWRKNNPEKIKRAIKLWHDNNIERVRKNARKWYKNKNKTDLKFNLNCKTSRAISHSLNGNKAGRHWEGLVGYTLKDLIKRLKKTMPNGYCWQDYLEGKLHIDHIIPINAFNYTKPEHYDFKRCWALSNLRLLPAKENMIKHDKLYKPFQPALKIRELEKVIING